LFLIKQFPDADVDKGKMIIDQDCGFTKKKTHKDGMQKVQKKWVKPDHGHAKQNVDGAFLNSDEAGIGMALRDYDGSPIVVGCRAISRCTDAVEAELMAIEEGFKLSMTCTMMPFTVESDCKEAVELICERTLNTSIYAFRVRYSRSFKGKSYYSSLH
jgi:hypothetical protein